jgi:lipopolysaccharide/colanic/teichoic acid biosynthesis glycosyltransferase
MGVGALNILGRDLLCAPIRQPERTAKGWRTESSVLFWKRAISVILAAITVLMAFPIVLIVAVAIKLDDVGPILFRQERVGKNGRLFTLYKFRSMRPDAGTDGRFHPVKNDDPRVTRCGHWLRPSHIDELPQLYNVLRGDMDLVGPRPFVLSEEEECAASIPLYRERWSVRPGITGWAQVNRGYCATIEDNTQKLAYDLFYISNMSVPFDLSIIFQTLILLVIGPRRQPKHPEG